MSITSRFFGQTEDGQIITEYTLTDADGSNVKLINYGCSITEINVPDAKGQLVNVTLGYDTIEEYEHSKTYFGAICGRCSNRIANGVFHLNGKEYHLFVNDGPNSLHGGKKGFCFRVWDAEAIGDRLVMRYISPDMEEGYPGKLELSVAFTYQNHRLQIACAYTCDQDTIANIINHSYFNLNGHDCGNILKHELQLDAEWFCEDDEAVMPYRAPIRVTDTPFDFLAPKQIGARLFEDCQQLRLGRGYDHNWCLRKPLGAYGHAAYARGDSTGITLDVLTDLPGIQFYSGNVIPNGLKGRNGCSYNQYSGFCLETQQYPNAIHVPEYPSIVLRAGEKKTCITEYVFGVKDEHAQ